MAEQKKYVCTLTPALLEKAERELNENPATRKRAIQALREMVEKYPGLKIRTDDASMLMFLRSRKFDIERSFNMLLNHYMMKLVNEDLFRDLRPSSVRMAIDDGVSGVLPNNDKQGCKVVIARFGKWDVSRYSMHTFFRAFYIAVCKIIKEEETQVNGIRLICDFDGLTLSHVLQMTPYYAKMLTAVIQDAFPARSKGVHFIKEPVIFDYAYQILKPFLNSKTVKRIHFHGQNIHEMTKFIDEEVLPEEYGGKQPPFSTKDWAEMILKCDAEFDEDSKYGMLNPAEQSIAVREDAIEGTVGKFKKLDV